MKQVRKGAFPANGLIQFKCIGLREGLSRGRISRLGRQVDVTSD